MRTTAFMLPVVLCLSLSAHAVTPIFTDSLNGGTVGAYQYVSWTDENATLDQWNSWIKYTQMELPSAAGTVSFSFDVTAQPDPYARIMSDAYTSNNGGTWPSFIVSLVPAGPDTYTLRFGYWHDFYWSWAAMGQTLRTGTWYSAGVSWGAQGQSIWVNQNQVAYNPYAASYQHYGTNNFQGWGLGSLCNRSDGGEALSDPWPYPSASPVSFRDLQVWDEQVEYGGTTPELPCGALLLLGALPLGLAWWMRRKA